jgi:hypothetical protein
MTRAHTNCLVFGNVLYIRTAHERMDGMEYGRWDLTSWQTPSTVCYDLISMPRERKYAPPQIVRGMIWRSTSTLTRL